MNSKYNLILIVFLLLMIVWSILICSCPLIEEGFYPGHHHMYYPDIYPGVYPYGSIPYWRRGYYRRLYAPWYAPLYIDDPIVDYDYCRKNPDCYPCPGWRFMGPPSCS
jgi:hypothetical protein